MFEQTFKNIDDILHKDAGCGSELDYVEQTSWVLFLKYLDDLEKDKKTAAELAGKTYNNIIENEYKWSVWAAPKLPDGKIDHNALTGDDLADFVKLQKTKAESENSWIVNVKDIDETTYDLSAKNPNKKEEASLRRPQEILEEMKALDEESNEILNSILELI